MSLGFDVAGWTTADVPRSAVDEYASWLRASRHAGMEYLERQLPRRADLSSTLPNAAGVLALGISHAFEDVTAPPGGVRLGNVARYAWTPDYHEQLQPLLSALEAEAARLGITARGTVDHAPVMERLLAGRAFLGWRGKSGMLVSTSLGAFTTLAVLLTDLPTPSVDEAHPDRCGRCARCVLACPTAAIGSDRAIDARRCVSYLTIEHRGPIPHALREGVGSWLFGCDGCLEVCPWSRKAGPLAQTLRPDPNLAHPDLTPFFTLTSRQFDKLYAGTAFSRPRRKGMARNACVVIGNTRAEQGRPLLDLAVRDPAWEVREAAAWALARFEAWRELALLEHDEHEIVRRTARHRAASF